MCKILQLRTPSYNILALRIVNGFVTIEDGYTLLTPRQVAEMLGVRLEIVEMADPDKRVDNKGQGQIVLRKQISPVAPQNSFAVTRKYMVIFKAIDGSSLPYDLYCKRIMAFVNPIIESSEELMTSTSSSSESILSTESFPTSSSTSSSSSTDSSALSAVSTSSESSTSSSSSSSSSTSKSFSSPSSLSTQSAIVDDSSSSSSDLPLDISYNFGSSPPSFGGPNSMFVTLSGDPGLGDDHTVVFTYPPQMNTTSPPSMVFTTANYFSSQTSTFNIGSLGTFSITYAITSLSRPGTRNGSIPFNIS